MGRKKEETRRESKEWRNKLKQRNENKGIHKTGEERKKKKQVNTDVAKGILKENGRKEGRGRQDMGKGRKKGRRD